MFLIYRFQTKLFENSFWNLPRNPMTIDGDRWSFITKNLPGLRMVNDSLVTCWWSFVIASGDLPTLAATVCSRDLFTPVPVVMFTLRSEMPSSPEVVHLWDYHPVPTLSWGRMPSQMNRVGLQASPMEGLHFWDVHVHHHSVLTNMFVSEIYSLTTLVVLFHIRAVESLRNLHLTLGIPSRSCNQLQPVQHTEIRHSPATWKLPTG